MSAAAARRAARPWLTALLLLGTTAGSAMRAGAQPAIPDLQLASGELAFDASASVGSFGGVTREVEGALTGGDGPAALRGWVRFDARTLRTGIGQRDRHMRESLEAEQHPYIRLDVERVEPTATRGDTVEARVHGWLTIRGVRRPLAAEATGWRTADGITVRSRFPLDLGDYEIGGLRRMLGLLRVDEDVVVRAELVFVAAGGEL